GLAAERLVAGIELDHAPAAGVTLIAEVARTQALVLLRVDEPLHVARRPLVLVDAERPQHSADQAELIVRVHDLERFGEVRVLRVYPQQPMREAMERADPQIPGRVAEQRLDPLAHLV